MMNYPPTVIIKENNNFERPSFWNKLTYIRQKLFESRRCKGLNVQNLKKTGYYGMECIEDTREKWLSTNRQTQIFVYNESEHLGNFFGKLYLPLWVRKSKNYDTPGPFTKVCSFVIDTTL